MPKDVFAVSDLAATMHAESRYKEYSFDKKRVTDSLLYQLANSVLLGFVDERNGKIIGIIAGYIDQYSFCDNFLLRDRGMYVMPEYRKEKVAAKLLRAYIAAAEKIGVKEIVVTPSYLEDPNAFDDLYKKVGFKKSGFRMEL